MINLTYTGMCEDCKHADLELDCLEYTRFDGVVKEWTVRCIHVDACDAMEERVTEKYADYVEYVCGTRGRTVTDNEPYQQRRCNQLSHDQHELA